MLKMRNMKKSIYLDYNSTSPVNEDILKKMLPIFTEIYGNPSNENHAHGEQARTIISEARKQVAKLVNMSPLDVIFTSGATEANNLALQGMTSPSDIPLILVGATEHKSILEVADALHNNKTAIVKKIPVASDGIIDPSVLHEMLKGVKGRILVSIMAANSETGTLQYIGEIPDIVHSYGGLVHCDATQSVCHKKFDNELYGLDMISLSSHKIYGPKGAGALIATREVRKMLHPILYGGGQEDNLRSGTLNVPSIAGFGMACEMAYNEIALSEMLGDGITYQKKLRDYLEKRLLSLLPDTRINGSTSSRIPNTTNIHFAGADADAVMSNMPNLSVSSGSACTSSTMEPSHVLTAMGMTFEEANQSIRFSLGRSTTKEEIDQAIDMVVNAVEFVRDMEGYIEKAEIGGIKHAN